ncbi:MAG: hypothetical protein M3508_04385 [Actinomycetota bacterium]|nr:hypothetical protein [Actinomycetota bacterium]
MQRDPAVIAAYLGDEATFSKVTDIELDAADIAMVDSIETESQSTP